MLMSKHRPNEGIKEGPHIVGINTRIKDHEIKLLQHARRTEGKVFLHSYQTTNPETEDAHVKEAVKITPKP
jgi:hypothetical protein